MLRATYISSNKLLNDDIRVYKNMKVGRVDRGTGVGDSGGSEWGRGAGLEGVGSGGIGAGSGGEKGGKFLHISQRSETSTKILMRNLWLSLPVRLGSLKRI